MKEFDEIRDEIAARYPHLLHEWNALASRPPAEAGQFLDKHFPIDGGWSMVPIEQAPEILRNWKPQ